MSDTKSEMKRISTSDLQDLKWDLRSQIDDFVDEVHPIFEKMEWEYGHRGIPDKDYLKAMIDTFITKLKDGESRWNISSGRIEVGYRYVPNTKQFIGYIDLNMTGYESTISKGY